MAVKSASSNFLLLGTLALGATAILTGRPARADEQGAPPASLRALAHCRTLSDDAARLACYDTESAALITATDTGDVAIVDKDDARKVRKSLFGFGVPKIALFGNGQESEDEQNLVSTVTSVEGLPRGYYRVTIAEGDAVWETTTRRRGQTTPRPGDKIEFEKAAMGSYWMRVNGQFGVKAHRVR